MATVAPDVMVDRGDHDRFDDLFAFQRIDMLLRRNPRAWLERGPDGRQPLSLVLRNFVPPASFLVADADGQMRVDAIAFNDVLRRGGTLVVVDAHLLDEGVAALAAAVAAAIGERVTVRAFASFGEVPVFRRHTDPFDTVVVQLVGEKHWTIQRPGSAPDRERTGAAIWDGVLTPGDVLLVPRGWWHSVAGCGAPSLHLSVDLRRRRGSDVLRAAMLEIADQGAAGIRLGESGAAAISSPLERLGDAVRHAFAEQVDKLMVSPSTSLRRRASRIGSHQRPSAVEAVAGRLLAEPDVRSDLEHAILRPATSTPGRTLDVAWLRSVIVGRSLAELDAELAARAVPPDEGICLPYSALPQPVDGTADLGIRLASRAVEPATPDADEITLVGRAGRCTLTGDDLAVASPLVEGKPIPVLELVARSTVGRDQTLATLSKLVRSGHAHLSRPNDR
jgi:hypothetical protein